MRAVSHNLSPSRTHHVPLTHIHTRARCTPCTRWSLLCAPPRCTTAPPTATRALTAPAAWWAPLRAAWRPATGARCSRRCGCAAARSASCWRRRRLWCGRRAPTGREQRRQQEVQAGALLRRPGAVLVVALGRGLGDWRRHLWLRRLGCLGEEQRAAGTARRGYSTRLRRLTCGPTTTATVSCVLGDM